MQIVNGTDEEIVLEPGEAIVPRRSTVHQFEGETYRATVDCIREIVDSEELESPMNTQPTEPVYSELTDEEAIQELGGGASHDMQGAGDGAE